MDIKDTPAAHPPPCPELAADSPATRQQDANGPVPALPLPVRHRPAVPAGCTPGTGSFHSPTAAGTRRPTRPVGPNSVHSMRCHGWRRPPLQRHLHYPTRRTRPHLPAERACTNPPPPASPGLSVLHTSVVLPPPPLPPLGLLGPGMPRQGRAGPPTTGSCLRRLPPTHPIRWPTTTTSDNPNA